MRHTMKVAAVMSVAALALAACGGTGDDPGTSGSSSSTTKKSDLKVGMAYDIGGRGDQSFNDSAAAGLDKAKTELGVDVKEAAAGNGETDAPARSGCSSSPRRLQPGHRGRLRLRRGASARSPRSTRTSTSRSSTTRRRRQVPNVDLITFAEEQGSFLVGAAAALKTKTRQRRLHRRRQRPADPEVRGRLRAPASKAVNPDIKVDVKYLTQPPDFTGFNDPAKGKTAAAGHVRRRRRRRLRGRRRLRRRRVQGRQGRRRAGRSASTPTSTSRPTGGGARTSS